LELQGVQFGTLYYKLQFVHHKTTKKDEGYGILKVKRSSTNRRQATVNWEFHTAGNDALVDSFELNQTM